MIDIFKFNEIRNSEHLVVLDTNILLELYRQPANISMDVISALEQIIGNIYVPQQVYNEYLRNYQKVCGDEKKKYKKVSNELSETVKKMQNDIASRASEYRKHNYTDVQQLLSDLNGIIAEMQQVINEYEKNHREEIRLNTEFLENDRVKQFVDLLSSRGCIGDKTKFSERLLILQEGQVRYENMIPPGYMDAKKEGIDKYGDLFVWKSIISVAKERNSTILFVCNDVKEDWWETAKDAPVDLRQELLEEFSEVNPTLKIYFLTLEKFFAYIAEELKLGKSKSALQLSATQDAEKILSEYEEEIEQSVQEYLQELNIEEELEEEFIETEDEKIYWDISNVSVEKEEKNIIYYIDLDISVMVDLSYNEPGNYPCYAGKAALALQGRIEIITEEYSKTYDFKNMNIEKEDMIHIEPEMWSAIKDVCKESSCSEIIATCKNFEQSLETIDKLRDKARVSFADTLQRLYVPNMEIPSIEGFENIAKSLAGVSQFAISPEGIKALEAATGVVVPLQQSASKIDYQGLAKALEPIIKCLEQTKKTEENRNLNTDEETDVDNLE